MGAYHQMGHDSWNLVGEDELADFSGIVLSPVNDSEAQVELQALVTWLNAITAAKPQTAFWSKYF